MTADKIVALMYHRIGQARNQWERQYCVSPLQFAEHVRTLAEVGMRAVDIKAFVAWLKGTSELPDGSFLLTFDDGFRSVRQYALPVLEQYRWPATVFLVTDLIGKRDEWTRRDNPDGVTYSLLDADEIRDMAQRGVSFHSHTCSHPRLTAIDDASVADELVRSRLTLRQSFGFESDFLAYPFGHVDARIEDAANAAGFSAAFSTQPGFNRKGVNRFRIRRLAVFGTDTPPMLLRKMRYGTNDGTVFRVTAYYCGQMTRRLRDSMR